jgi:type I restriction enzyme R subunit
MRRIKSRILFEQMMGRATRLCPEIHKTHFEIYDPVGVYDSLEDVNTMKPVVANPATTFSQLFDGLEVMEDEKQVQYQINQILAKMQRKKRSMSGEDMEHFISMTGGKDPTQVIFEVQQCKPTEAKKRLLAYADAIRRMQQIRDNGSKPVVVSLAEDELLYHVRGYGSGSRPEDYLDAFAAYIKTNMNEIAALNIVCTRPKELTRESLKSLRLTLDREGFTTQQLNTAISQMTNEEITSDIISLIRRYAIGSPLISHEARIRRAVDRLRKAHSFSKQELNWISRMEKYLMEESVLNVSVFDEDGRFKAQGGFAKINKVFQNKLESIVLELNEYLYDDGGHAA